MSCRELGRIDALILAGGLGTRLRSVVPDQQKVFAPVGAHPFVARILAQLQRAGVRRVVFALGHLAEAARPLIARLAHDTGLTLVESVEPQPLGTAGAIRHALPLLHSDPVLVLNGDSFIDADLDALLAHHLDMGRQATLCAVEVEEVSRYGALTLDATASRVLSFREKAADSGRGWINAGIYLLSRPLIEALAADAPASLEHDVFPQQVANGLGVHCERRPFIDIGTPASYAAGEHFFAP